MNKIIALVAVFFIGCSKTPPPPDMQADNQPTPSVKLSSNSKTTCQDILEAGEYFSSSDALRLSDVALGELIFKDQFESTKDFNLRKQNNIESVRVKAESTSSEFGISGIVKFRYIYSLSAPIYNADKKVITVPKPGFGSEFGELFSNSKFKGFRSGFDYESKDGRTEIGPYGTKTKQHSSSGIAFKTQLKHPFLLNKQKSITFNESPEVAKALLEITKSPIQEDFHSNIALAVAGRLIPPYKINDSHSGDDLSSLTTTVYSHSTLYLDVTCAAIIDLRTNKILVELR